MTHGPSVYNCKFFDGIDEAWWRQTKDLDKDTIIECPPIGKLCSQFLSDKLLQGVTIASTIVRFTPKPSGSGSKPFTLKSLRIVMSNIHGLTTAFLLGAMVLLAAGAHWNSNWTTRPHETATADTWEVLDMQPPVNECAWRAGRLHLGRLGPQRYPEQLCSYFVMSGPGEKAPRLVCIATLPTKSRQEIRDFPEFTSKVSAYLSGHGRDFLLETPLIESVMESRRGHELSSNESHFTSVGHMCRFGARNSKGELMKRPTWWLTSPEPVCQALDKHCEDTHKSHGHGSCQGISEVKKSVIMPAKDAVAVMKGFRETVLQKEPSRIHNLSRALGSRIRAFGMFADDAGADLRWAQTCLTESFMIVNEGKDIPGGGVEFVLPPDMQNVPKSLPQSVRRLHVNSRHPPNADLERIVRLAVGSETSRAVVKGIVCPAWPKAAPGKSAKPWRVRDNIGQFDETVVVDLVCVKGSTGVTRGFAVIVDVDTDWSAVKRILDGKTAGPPDRLEADSERGFSQTFAGKVGRAGVLLVLAAGYAPWQKGKCERKIQSFKNTVKKTVLHSGIRGADDMRMAGGEAISAINQRPGASGVSAGMMLFGQRTRLYGEPYANGEPTLHHLDTVAARELNRRLQIRNSAKQATDTFSAKEMVRKTVSARTRKINNTSVGEIVFFYRNCPNCQITKVPGSTRLLVGTRRCDRASVRHRIGVLCGSVLSKTPCGVRLGTIAERIQIYGLRSLVSTAGFCFPDGVPVRRTCW